MEGITITWECPDQKSICWPPLLELMCGIRHAKVGDVVAVQASDEESKRVIPLWIEKAKEELIGTEEIGDATRYIVRKVH